MPRIAYIEKVFQTSSEHLIQIADKICREYNQKGFDLTLRQLFYQFVARDIIPNSERSYKRLGKILSNARLAGLLDWDHMVDRTRYLQGNEHWNDPADIIGSAVRNFQIDKWEGQETRVEVWIEKEALAGVVNKICTRLDVDFFACRGYVSLSEMWRASNRINNYNAEEVVILHLGDHDPSGMDMTRDIEDRLDMFGANATVKRIALNMDQVEQFNPPPNPTKPKDSRSPGYISRYGRKSWELDALDPERLMSVIERHVEQYRDQELFSKRKKEEEEHIRMLNAVSDRWDEVEEFLNEQ